MEKPLFQFGPFQIDTIRRVLTRAGDAVPLTPKAFDTLLVLVENSPRLVTKEELIERVWPDTVVEENNLTQNISALRKALGETRSDHRFIVTVPGQGYRFVAPLNGNAAVIEKPAVPPKPKNRLAAAIAIVLVIAAGLAAMILIRQKEEQTLPQPFQVMRITRLKTSSSIRNAAISPDGKYAAYVASQAGRQSLWIKLIAADSNVCIISPSEILYRGLTFSPDGNYIFYSARNQNEATPALYQVPVLGGSPKKVKEDVWGPIAFSPDGNRFAFVRESNHNGEDSLVISSRDGAEETKLASRKHPDRLRSPAWSPDGKWIACSDGNADTGLPNIDLVSISVEDGSERRITRSKWAWIGSLAWLPDSEDLLIIGREMGYWSSQVWRLSSVDGQARRITNDLSSYTGLSTTADAKSLITGEALPLASIWVAPGGDAARAKQITSKVTWYPGLAWTPEGELVYASKESDDYSIWTIDPASGIQRHLAGETPLNISPSVSPDGRQVVFVSDRSGSFNLWRINIDGSDLKQVSFDEGEHHPHCSPDGKWIVYTSIYSTKPTIWKVPLDGGASVQLCDRYSTHPAVSPDGKRIACFYRDRSDALSRVAIISSDGGGPEKVFDLPASVDNSAGLRWNEDGSALIYVDTRDGVSNLWRLPINGGPAKQMTEFKSDRIYSFDWSRDGRLACVRGAWTYTAVLISNFK